MHQTHSLSRLASTKGGMRKILKTHLSAVDYIKHAVETGVYKKIYYPDKNEQNVILQRGGRRNGGNPRQNYQQQGGDSSRMPKINPYPSEYEILTMNPPLPMKPRLSKKDLRYLRWEKSQKEKLAKEAKAAEEGGGKTRKDPSSFGSKYDRLPTDKYVRDYMHRYDERMRSSASNLSDAQKEEAYYRSILDIQSSDDATNSSSFAQKTTYEDKDSLDASFFVPKEMKTAMGRKPHVLSHAYEFALKQYEVLSDNENMSEEESIQVVEELLQQEANDEMLQSRIRAQKIKEEMEMKKKQEGEGEDFSSTTLSNESSQSLSPTSSSTRNSTTTPASTIPSILYSKPRTIQALTIWGQRLQAVPYNQWTLGATTALDHWIAVDVLGMKEDTWQRLLSGELESDVNESRGNDVVVGNMARTKDIIIVRSTLFPETVAHMMEDEEEEAEIAAVGEEMGGLSSVDAEKDATERSIDELLASLGGMDENSEDNNDEEVGEGLFASSEDDGDLDSRVERMVETLQEWRKVHDEKPYDEWDTEKKKEFDAWFSDYLDLVTNESDGEVDIAATRNALLSEPPISRETSDSFWSHVQDEADAEILLHEILERGPPSPPTSGNELPSIQKSREALEVFLNLPRDQQLRQLVRMGTLRPILDEYYSEADRMKFMEQHGQTLLDGVEVEHLVNDPDGHITLQDIGDDELTKKVDADTKFSIKKIPFGTDEYGMGRNEKARMLYRAWNMQKAGRARYAELRFKQGKMPLKEEE